MGAGEPEGLIGGEGGGAGVEVSGSVDTDGAIGFFCFGDDVVAGLLPGAGEGGAACGRIRRARPS